MKSRQTFDRREVLKISALFGLNYGLSSLLRPPSRQANQPGTNVLIIVFDALSALNLNLYGYPRKNSPFLHQFAENAIVFHNHYSGGNFTASGTASLLTGTIPWTHRNIRLDGHPAKAFEKQNIFSLFDTHYRIAYTHNHLANILLHDLNPQIDEHVPIQELFKKHSLIMRLFGSDFYTATHVEKIIYDAKLQVSTSLLMPRIYKSLINLQEEMLTEQYGEQFPLGLPSIGSTPT
ncbi:sulfatase-like hydrolase/transferase, partial [Chloroflexota bacterium]